MKPCPCTYQEHPLEHRTDCASYVPPLTSEEITALRALLDLRAKVRAAPLPGSPQ